VLSVDRTGEHDHAADDRGDRDPEQQAKGSRHLISP
jgi:hypothetical protein